MALSPAVAVILKDLGLEDRVVGRHGWDLALGKAVPVVGDQAGIDYEQLLRAEPTHVLLEWGSRDLPPRLAALAERRGWVVQSLPLLSIQDVTAAPERIAGLLGDPEASRRASELRRALESALEPLAPDVARAMGNALPVYFTDPVGVAGPGSFHHAMLERLGIEPAAVGSKAYVELDPEDLRRLDPSWLIVFSPAPPEMDDAQRARTRAQRLEATLVPLERLALRAVREKRVALVDHPLCLQGATSLAATARELRAAAQRLAEKHNRARRLR